LKFLKCKNFEIRQLCEILNFWNPLNLKNFQNVEISNFSKPLNFSRKVHFKIKAAKILNFLNRNFVKILEWDLENS